MPYLSKTAGQDVQEETADKPHCVNGHGFPSASMSIIPSKESNLAIPHGENAVIGNGDPMGVASKR